MYYISFIVYEIMSCAKKFILGQRNELLKTGEESGEPEMAVEQEDADCNSGRHVADVGF